MCTHTHILISWFVILCAFSGPIFCIRRPACLLFAGKGLSPARAILWLPVGLCVGLLTLACLLLSSSLGSHVGEPLWVWLLTFLGDSLTANSLIFWLLQSFCPASAEASLSLRWGCCVVCLVGTGLHKLAFWLLVVFCYGLLLLKSEVSLMRSED